MTHTSLSGWWMLALLSSVISGCGTVGPPMAPEDVGIGPLIERQKKMQAQTPGQEQPALDSTKSEAPELSEPPGQDEVLPPLRPIGGR